MPARLKWKREIRVLPGGAVYAEFESPVSDVKQQGGDLNVEKQLYVERTVNNVPQLQPITAKNGSSGR